MKAKIATGLSKAANYYTNSIIQRGIVVSIPYAGGVIDAILTGISSKEWQAKVNVFFEDYKQKMEDVNSRLIDKKYIESEEFEALINKILMSLRNVHEREKIELFASILKNSCVKEYSGEYWKERFINLVDELSYIHIQILKLFKDKITDLFMQRNNNIVLDIKSISKLIKMDIHDTELFCSELVAKGLLFDPYIGDTDYKRGSFALHKSSVKFFNFIFSD